MGSLSPSGGIRSGDSMPATAGAPLLPVTPQADQIPLLVWDGDLWDSDRGMVIVPTVWEWDGDDSNYRNWSGWLLGTRYDWLDKLRSTFIRDEPQRMYPIGPKLGEDQWGIQINESSGKDLPIGYSNIGMTSLTTNARISFSSMAFLVNRAALERLLGRASTAILAMNWSTVGGVGGKYDIFLQVERLP
jgi:hypothetical protein